MPYEVTIEQRPNSTRIMVPLDIPTVFVEAGAIEQYATIFCGWTPMIRVRNEETADFDEVVNPLSAIDACAERIRGFVRGEYSAFIANSGAEAGRTQALSQFDSAFQ